MKKIIQASAQSPNTTSIIKDTTRLVIHYKRAKADYDNWNVWVWVTQPDGRNGKAYAFNQRTDFGIKAVIEIPNQITQFGFIVRRGEWQAKDITIDRFVTINAGDDTDIFVFQGRKEFETSKLAADTYFAQAPPPRGLPAFLDSPNTIHATLDETTQWRSLVGQIKITIAGKKVGFILIAPQDIHQKVQLLTFKLDRAVTPQDLRKRIELNITGDLPRTVYARGVLDDRAYYYDGADLGSRWTQAATSFKIWTPIASKVELLLFADAIDAPERILKMAIAKNGTWSLEVPGDLHGYYYQYRIESYDETRITTDINAYAASRNSKRSMVVDLARTNPQDWGSIQAPRHAVSTEAVLYELMIRDFTIDPSSGIKPEWRGKYLGLTQRGTTVPGSSQKTGLDYLIDLGVTDIHFLPFQNFDPANMNTYNWGYETNLFNVPEEQYSTTPDNPTNTIKEVKTMIQALHNATLRVVMDVVYNHTMPAVGEDSAFWQTVPYFYVRTNDRGDLLNESGVGNAIHDERPMVRKYIRDSLIFWLNEYQIDGFRFDLIGMFSQETVQDLTAALHTIQPDALVYGEPWTGGGPLRFGKGAQYGTDFAVFNDNFRNAIRGDLDGVNAGFSMGGSNDNPSMNALKKGLVGSIAFSDEITDFTQSPLETINYVSAHDNMTLWDKITQSMPGASFELQTQALKFSGAIVLLSQGIPFLEGGAEIGRTKNGLHNSYNAGDTANKYDWTRAIRFQNVYMYYQGLIEIRKTNPSLRLSTAVDVQQNLEFLTNMPAAVVGFTLEGILATSPQTLILLNGSRNSNTIKLPFGKWKIIANAYKAGLSNLGTASEVLKLEALSAYILYSDK